MQTLLSLGEIILMCSEFLPIPPAGRAVLFLKRALPLPEFLAILAVSALKFFLTIKFLFCF